jgi:CRISPR-associated endonuclease/helicase Cas3
VDTTLTFWGKTFLTSNVLSSEGPLLAYKPVLHHMIDVAAVALAYLRAQPARARREAVSFGVAPNEYMRMAAFCAGLHDLGKFTRSFQAKRSDLWPVVLGPLPTQIGQAPTHWRATGMLLRFSSLAAGFRQYFPGIEPGYEIDLVAAISGHHGRPPPKEDSQRAFDVALNIGDWIDAACVAAADAAFTHIAGLTQASPSPTLDADRAAAVSWSLSGLITLADWVGSDAEFFGPTPLQMPLDDYWLNALRAAERALSAKGLDPAELAPRPSLQDLAPRAASSPRPMQSLAQSAPVSNGPQLVIVEDATGSGKTEAAILLAARMVASGRGEGLFVALPTMATANAMHGRLAVMSERLFVDTARHKPSLVLAHGKAALSRALEELTATPLGDGEETTAASCNAWITDDRRRAFFADVGAGTVDQAFLAVLPKKHLTLRQYGLAGRILIVDEAHCFDAYMKEELDALLRLHAMNGGSAIVLSATLSKEARRKMAAAFFRGLGLTQKQSTKGASGCSSDSYPLMTRVDRTTVTELQSQLANDLARRVNLVRLGDRATAATEARAAAAAGGAVLIICNAVDECIAVYRLIAALRPEATAHLFHARFAQCDRIAIEDAVLDRFGRDGRAEQRMGHILIATQVVEQSLDLDFDLVISDLAPIDLIIQRAGRLWRHMDLRPAASRPIAGPTMMVISPDPDDVTTANWLRATLGSAANVYHDVGVMWRTARTIVRYGRIQVPDDLRPMIEAVYAKDGESVPEPLKAAEQLGLGKSSAEGTLGAFNVVKLREGYGALPPDLRQDEDIGTRLGDPTITLRLARRNEERLVPWFDRKGTPPHVAWALSEVTVRRALWSNARLPAADEGLRRALMRDWTEWEQSKLPVEVASDGTLRLENASFCYDTLSGLKKM